MSASKALATAMEESAAETEASPNVSPMQRLSDAMDKAALTFCKLLENEDKDPETNTLVVSFKERQDTFKMVADWIAKRQRAGIGDEVGGEVAAAYGELMQGLKDGTMKVVPAATGPGRISNDARARAAALTERLNPQGAAKKTTAEDKNEEDEQLRDRLNGLATQAGVSP